MGLVITSVILTIVTVIGILIYCIGEDILSIFNINK